MATRFVDPDAVPPSEKVPAADVSVVTPTTEIKGTLEIKNIGPISQYVMPIRPGPNECGKSTVISCVGALMSGDTDLPVRDGQKSGIVEGFGCQIIVAKKSTIAGELDVDDAQSGNDLGEFVSPAVKTKEPRLKSRVKTLLSLTKTKIGFDNFKAILPDNLQGELLASDYDEDPIVMAGRIKRRMEAKAKEWEAKANNTNIKVTAEKSNFEGVDLEAFDEAAVQAEYSAAVRAEQQLEGRSLEVIRAQQSVESARSQLAELGTDKLISQRDLTTSALEKDRLSLFSTREEIDNLNSKLNVAKIALEGIERDLKGRQTAANEMENQIKLREENLKTVNESIQRHGTLAEVVGKVIPPLPPIAEVESAKKVKEAAFAKVQGITKIKAAKEAKDRHEALRIEYAEQVGLGEIFRKAASQVYAVLSNSLKCKTLKIIEGDLNYVEGARNEEYDRLSDGKRCQVAIAEIANAVGSKAGKMAILPMAQPFWEGLDASNRALVTQACIEHNIGLVTGEHSDDTDAKLTSYYYVPKIG